MQVVALLCFSLFLLYPCTSFLSSMSPRVKCTEARARKFDEADFVEIKVPRPLGLDLEEVDDGVFRGVYIAGFTKDGNADKALRKEFLTPTNLFIVKANNVDVRNSNFDEVMDAITTTDGDVSLTLIDPNAVIKGTATLNVIDGDGNTRQIKCLKGQRLRTVLNDNNIEVQDPKGSNCGGGGICGTCVVDLSIPDNDWSAKPDFETKKLKKFNDSCRLSCNVIVEGDATVSVKPKSTSGDELYKPNPANVV